MLLYIMYNPSQAYNAYAESANEINSNLASYRADVDNIKGINKQLVQQAREKTDIDAIRDIASEAGVRAFKSAMEKYGSKIYDAKIPGLGGSIKDADTRLGQALEDRARPVINDLRARGQTIADNVRNTVNDLRGRGERAVQERVRQLNGNDPEENGVEMQEMGTEPGQESANNNIGSREDVNEDGTNMTDDLEDMGEDIDMGEGQFNGTFEDFMNQFDVARKPNGDIDFETENNRLGMVNEDLEAQAHREQLTQPERPEQQPQQEMNENHEENNNEQPEEEETPNEQFEDEQNDAQDEAEDLNEGDDLQGDTADAMEGLGEEGAEAGAEAGAGLAEGSGIAEGLEEGAGALAATGIGAPIAGALAVAGGLVEAFTLFESGKGIVDWFEQDVLGQHPKAPQVKIPKMGLTSAERGQMIVPTSDTLDTQLPVGGW